MSYRVATLFLSIVVVLSFVGVTDSIEDSSTLVSGAPPADIATIEVEFEKDFLVVGYSSNILIWVNDSTANGIEGIIGSIILKDDDPGSNSQGWFSGIYEIGGGAYNATYFAPLSADPNLIVNVSNSQNSIYTLKTIILINEGGPVEINNDFLNVEDLPFYIQGLSYAPTYNGSDKYDDGAVKFDMLRIAEANVNTIRLYVTNKYFWGGQLWTDARDSSDVILDYADIYDIKVIVGFWADENLNWTDQYVRENQTLILKDMVLRYKDCAPVLMWALGNEVINNMDSANKIAYAQWMEDMAQWIHANDPNHPVTYSDAGVGEISTLKTHTPNLDIYSFNHYDFENAIEFQNVLDYIYSNWDIPVFLNEYGSDSRDNDAGSENQTLHAQRLLELYNAVENVNRTYPPGFLGSLWFEWTDQWNFEGNSSVQDPGTWWGWSPTSCFDLYADLEYFGIAGCANYGESEQRTLKDAYWTLKELYNQSQNILIPLKGGWNLVSLPLDIENKSLESTLQSIEGMYDAVQYYDAFDTEDPWKHYHTSKPAHLNDLSFLNKSMGFWLHITKAGGVNLTLRERKLSGNVDIILNKGWNLVGFPSSIPRAKDTVVSDLLGPIRFMGKGPTHDPHSLRIINDNETLYSNSGYWIHSPITQVWTLKSDYGNNPFFTTTGPDLMLNGNQIRLVGANSYGILSGYLNIGYVTDSVQNSTQRFFDAKSNDIRIMRFWLDVAPSDYWFGEVWDKWGSPSDHSTYFAALDDLIADAKANDIFIVPSFASAYDQWTAQGGGENFWMVNSSSNLLFKDWVGAIVTRYANEPQIAFWELANEANYFSKIWDSRATLQEVISWAQDLNAYIKSLDSNHLVQGGWNNMGNMDMAGFEALNNFLDLSSHHIYDNDLYAYEDGLGITDPREAVDDYVMRFTDYSHNILNMPIFFGEFNGNLTEDPENPFVRWFLESCYNHSADSALIWSWEEGYTTEDYLITPAFRPVIAQDISFWSEKFQGLI